MARRAVATSEDFLLSGRSLPAWVTGLAFISANLGAIEILGMAANGAQYGLPTVHFYWIGPGHGVPRRRDDAVLLRVTGPQRAGVPVASVQPGHAPVQRADVRAGRRADAGVNLYALALVINALIGWPIWLSIAVSAFFVLAYIALGGLSGAIYNEVLQ